MPFRDLREYLDRLEEAGELMRVTAEVDWNLELGAISRRSMDLRGPALLFENIKGYPGQSVFANSVTRSRDSTCGRLALAMDLPASINSLDLIREYAGRMRKPLPPVLVETAPCKENIIKGDDVDLLRFPTPLIHGVDQGRYIGTWHVDVTKDPDSKEVNWGVYRHVIHGPRTLGFSAGAVQHGAALFYRRYESRNEPMPLAIAIGTEPVATIAAGTPVAAGIQEVDLAGGLRGAPVELVKCETIDLEVPASSEIVLEGHVLPHVREMEGPFGEFTGYAASDQARRPVFQVDCITYRTNPILSISNIGKPWDEESVLVSIQASAVLREDLRSRGIKFGEVYVAPPLQAVIVSCDAPYAGYLHVLASAIWSTKYGIYRPYIFVVGEDVDVTNLEDVWWCLTTRLDPAHGIHVQPETPMSGLWPWVKPDDRAAGRGSKVYFDATFPPGWSDDYSPKVVDFRHGWPPAVQDRVLRRWGEYGFTEGEEVE